MTKTRTVAGIDIGHSAVKTCFTNPDSQTFQFLTPSAVCQALTISDETEAARAAKETVIVNGRPFFIGDTARIQSASKVCGLSEDWIETSEHVALFLGALQRIQSTEGSSEVIDVVMGLPTHLYRRQKDNLSAILRSHANPERLGDLRVVPQSMAPYYRLMIDVNGAPSTQRSPKNESWAVVEVGYFTTDFMLTMNGHWVEHGANQDSCPGIRAAAESLIRLVNDEFKVTIDMVDAESALLTRRVKYYGEVIDVSRQVEDSLRIVVDAVLDAAARRLESSARNLDGILVAGGGAEVVFPQLKEKWRHSVMDPQPRIAVADGLRRFGLAMALLDKKA